MPESIDSPDDAFKTAAVAVVDDESDETDEEAVELSEDDQAIQKWLDAEQEWKTWFDPDWSFERVEYKGDYLAVHTPLMQALGAFQLSSSKFVSADKQNDMAGLFVDMHLGPESYDQVMKRLMSPLDPDYTTKSVSEIMGLIMNLAIEKIKAEEAAKKEAEKKAPKKALKLAK